MATQFGFICTNLSAEITQQSVVLLYLKALVLNSVKQLVDTGERDSVNDVYWQSIVFVSFLEGHYLLFEHSVQ
jgi:hypothetical protein